MEQPERGTRDGSRSSGVLDSARDAVARTTASTAAGTAPPAAIDAACAAVEAGHADSGGDGERDGAGGGAGADAVTCAAACTGASTGAGAGAGAGADAGASRGDDAVADPHNLGYGHDVLDVRTSMIPGAGRGLFVTAPVSAGSVVAVYTGDVLRTVQAMRVADKSYLMRLGPQAYVDARTRLDVLARFINDCRNPAKHNVRFEKQPDRLRALVIATRDIVAGEELYVDYGKWYWAKTKGNRL